MGEMVIKSIPAIHDYSKGASRAAIANWIQKNYNKEAGGQFNANLKKALAKGIETGQLKFGETEQRYRINRDYKDPKKAKKKRQKNRHQKRKTSSKKKSTPKK